MTDERRSKIYTLCITYLEEPWGPMPGKTQYAEVGCECTLAKLVAFQAALGRDVLVNAVCYYGDSAVLELEWEEA